MFIGQADKSLQAYSGNTLLSSAYGAKKSNAPAGVQWVKKMVVVKDLFEKMKNILHHY